jgi:hypothetical protein
MSILYAKSLADSTLIGRFRRMSGPHFTGWFATERGNVVQPRFVKRLWGAC